jgi:hypothetical protein
MNDEMKPQQGLQRPDHEGQMAKSELYRAAKMSMKLFQMIQDGQQLEGWVQAKISKSADYLDSVYHYMEYQMKFGSGGVASTVNDITDDMEVGGADKVAEEDDELPMEMEESMNYEQKLNALLEGAVKKEKKVKEGFPTVAGAKAAAEKTKTTGKFDKKELKPGVTQYTRKASTFTDGGDDKDTKNAKKKAKQKDESIEEAFPTVADAKARAEKEKTTGKFDKKELSTGTQYTRKASTFTDGGDDKDTKNAKKKAKTNEASGANKTDVAMAYLMAVVNAPTGTSEKRRLSNWQQILDYKFDIAMDTATLAQMLPQLDSQLQSGKLDKLQNRMISRGELSIESVQQGVSEGIKDIAKKVGKAITGPDDEELIQRLEKETGGKRPEKKEKKDESLVRSIVRKVVEAKKKEGSKPDFLDMDKDGDKKEPMKKAIADNKVSEGSKPDFLDMDKDGDKKEPMKKAIADKKKTVKESAELDYMLKLAGRRPLNG